MREQKCEAPRPRSPCKAAQGRVARSEAGRAGSGAVRLEGGRGHGQGLRHRERWPWGAFASSGLPFRMRLGRAEKGLQAGVSRAEAGVFFLRKRRGAGHVAQSWGAAEVSGLQPSLPVPPEAGSTHSRAPTQSTPSPPIGATPAQSPECCRPLPAGKPLPDQVIPGTVEKWGPKVRPGMKSWGLITGFWPAGKCRVSRQRVPVTSWSSKRRDERLLKRACRPPAPSGHFPAVLGAEQLSAPDW